jgi:hypothetical protein
MIFPPTFIERFDVTVDNYKMTIQSVLPQTGIDCGVHTLLNSTLIYTNGRFNAPSLMKAAG